jgi:hypothetical protein
VRDNFDVNALPKGQTPSAKTTGTSMPELATHTGFTKDCDGDPICQYYIPTAWTFKARECTVSVEDKDAILFRFQYWIYRRDGGQSSDEYYERKRYVFPFTSNKEGCRRGELYDEFDRKWDTLKVALKKALPPEVTSYENEISSQDYDRRRKGR